MKARRRIRGRTVVAPFATAVLVLALAPPGRASGWKVSYAYSGQDISTATGRAEQTTDWPAGPFPDPQQRTVAASAGQGPNSVSVSASSAGSVTVTLTWDRAPNDMNDKPPDKIMVLQTSTASWRGQFAPLQGMPQSFQFSGSLSNGLSSPVVLSNTDLTRSGSCSGVKVLDFRSPNDYNRDGQDPISVTLPPVILRAYVSGTGSGGTTSCTSSLTYLAGVIAWHAHPVNYREVSRVADSPAQGELTFSYIWDSSSGNLADLDRCLIGEWVSYDGNRGTYIPGGTDADGVPYNLYVAPCPPFGSTNPDGTFTADAFLNPMRSAPWGIATGGRLDDIQHIPPLTGPCGADTVAFTGHQVYGFHCNVCMGTDITVFQVLMGGIAIDRSVSQRTYPPNATWIYTITKSGLSASLTLNP